ncbi:MAG: hypothetical protein R3D26_17915 [Cyanobacteriota/Melainabacteria group bacterium]
MLSYGGSGSNRLIAQRNDESNRLDGRFTAWGGGEPDVSWCRHRPISQVLRKAGDELPGGGVCQDNTFVVAV